MTLTQPTSPVIVLCGGITLSFMTSLVSLAAEADVPALHEKPIFMSPWGYAAIAAGLFILLFLLLWAFRNTAARFGQAPPKGTTPGVKSHHGTGH